MSSLVEFYYYWALIWFLATSEKNKIPFLQRNPWSCGSKQFTFHGNSSDSQNMTYLEAWESPKGYPESRQKTSQTCWTCNRSQLSDHYTLQGALDALDALPGYIGRSSGEHSFPFAMSDDVAPKEKSGKEKVRDLKVGLWKGSRAVGRTNCTHFCRINFVQLNEVARKWQDRTDFSMNSV